MQEKWRYYFLLLCLLLIHIDLNVLTQSSSATLISCNEVNDVVGQTHWLQSSGPPLFFVNTPVSMPSSFLHIPFLNILTIVVLWMLVMLFFRTSGMDSISSLSAVYGRGPKKYALNISDVCLWRNYLVFACCTYPHSPPCRSDSPDQDGG